MPFIKCEWKNRLHAYIGGIIKGMDAVPLAVGGLDDHVHVLAGLNSSHRLDYFVRDIKADSSVFVHQEFDKKFTWQKGYGAFTVSPSAIESVRRYILNQEHHHRKRSFQQEYVELLDRSGMPYDEKYLW